MKRPDPNKRQVTLTFWCSEYAPSLVKCLSHQRHHFLGCVPSPWSCVSQEERQRAPAPSSVRLLVQSTRCYAGVMIYYNTNYFTYSPYNVHTIYEIVFLVVHFISHDT